MSQPPPSFQRLEQQRSWDASQSSGAPAPAPRRPTALIAAVIGLVVAVAALGTVAFVQTNRLSDQRSENAALEHALEERDAEIESLREALESRPLPDASGTDELPGGEDLEDLLDGGLDGLLEEFEDLFGPDGPLGDLQGGLGDLGGLGDDPLAGAADTADCLVGATDLPDITGDTLTAQIESSVATAEAIRGDAFPEPLEPMLLDGAEIRERIEQEVAEEYDEATAEIDRAMLSLIGAVPPTLDLRETQTELLSDQVAGFYDPETGELVVRAERPSDALDVTGLITLVHELEHALADAVVGLPDLEASPDDEDAAIAQIAVIEGDAVALQTIATSVALSPDALLQALTDPDVLTGNQGLDEVPPYIASSLVFPYTAGPGFVCDALAAGGWDAVDELLRDPPDTTWEVIFGEPVEVLAPETLTGPEGYELLETRTFGAAQLSWLFEAPAGDRSLALPDPQEAVRPWRGGAIQLWRGPAGDYAAGLALRDAGGLCDPVVQWWEAVELETRAEGEVRCRDAGVVVGVADDPAVAEAVIGE